MFIVLIFLSFLFLLLIVYSKTDGFRESLLKAALLFGGLVGISTEILGYFKLIKPDIVEFLWGFFAFGLFVFIVKKIEIKKLKKPDIKDLDGFSKILLYVITFYLLAGFVEGLLIPPNNFDSINYHLPRVMNWIQQASVDHYPTSIIPQLILQPWSEYLNMHSVLLSGGDFFINFFQWFATILILAGVSLIAKTLGADKKAQILACFITITLPMAIAQMMGGDNDVYIVLWCVVAVYFIIKFVILNKLEATYVALSLGLATFTKGTAYMYLCPFVLWFAIVAVKKLRWQSIKPFILMIIAYLVLNTPLFIRNYRVFDHILGPQEQMKAVYYNRKPTIPVFIVNIAKNASLHFFTPSRRANAILVKGITKSAKALGVDVNDKRINHAETFFNSDYIAYETRHIPGNPLHLILYILCGSVVFIRFRRDKNLFLYTLSVFGGIIIFSSILSWQPWMSRHHIPFFVLSSVFSAIVLEKLNRKIMIFIISILFLYSLPQLLYSKKIQFAFEHPSRVDQLFYDNPTAIEGTKKVVAEIKRINCHQIAFYGNEWQSYPVRAILKSEIGQFEIKNVNFYPDGTQSLYEEGYLEGFNPCYYVYFKQFRRWQSGQE